MTFGVARCQLVQGAASRIRVIGAKEGHQGVGPDVPRVGRNSAPEGGDA